MAEPQKNGKKYTGDTGENAAGAKQHGKLADMLCKRYKINRDVTESECQICGEHRSQLRWMSNGLLMCDDCRGSEVVSMGTAAGLLYTTYGSFKRLFRGVRFRYPDLEISQQSMYHVGNITHGSSSRSGLLTVLDDRDDKFSIRIVRDIPYCFLEELYAQAFAQQLNKSGEIILSNGEKKETMDWLGSTARYLIEVGRGAQSQLLKKSVASGEMNTT